MVIFICGEVGVGKTSLAKAISQLLDIRYCEADQIKSRFITPNNRGIAKTLISDTTRSNVSHALVEELELLSQTHRHILVDDTLHRDMPRRILFDAANVFFGGYRIVRISTREDIVTERLVSYRDGHLLSMQNLADIRTAVRNQMQNFNEPVFEHDNSADFKTSAELLAHTIAAWLRHSG